MSPRRIAIASALALAPLALAALALLAALSPALANDASVRALARGLRERARASGAEIAAEERQVGNLGYDNGCEAEVVLALRGAPPPDPAHAGDTVYQTFCDDGERGLGWWWPGEGCLRMERADAQWRVPDAPVDLGLDPAEHDALAALAEQSQATHLVRLRVRLGGWRDLDLRCH